MLRLRVSALWRVKLTEIWIYQPAIPGSTGEYQAVTFGSMKVGCASGGVSEARGKV